MYELHPQFTEFHLKICKIIAVLLLPDTPMTLNQGQGHLNQYQNVKYNSINHHAKSESN